MRASLRATALLLFVVACGDSTKPPAPAQVTLSAVATPLDAIGATATVVAVVTDDGGGVMDERHRHLDVVERWRHGGTDSAQAA